MKRQLEEERLKVELQKCTFKPNLNHQRSSLPVKPTGKEIKGFSKAIERMKVGYEKNKNLQKELELRNGKQVEFKVESDPIRPTAPRFHVNEHR